MATFELPEMPEPRVSPHMMMGAASPLWGYFGAAAAGGVAYWWMTRWTQPMNLEALFGAAARAVLAPAEAALAAEGEAVAGALEDLSPPVGGESAPISALVEGVVEPTLEPEQIPEPAAQATALLAEASPQVTAEAAAEPPSAEPPPPEAAPRPRLRKGPPPSGAEDEA